MKGSYPHTVIQWRNLTHIAHSFIFPYADGGLDLSGFSLYPELIQAARQNSVGIVIAVGGWDVVRTPRFSQMVADSNARRRFVQNLKNFCLTYGYDGADIDWEYPSASDRPNATLLFKELRQAFSDAFPPLTLSIAAPSADWGSRYDWSVMKDVLDWMGVMTYDFYGSWTTKAGPNSPLFGTAATTDQGWIDNSVAHYLAKGMPASKILIGIPFYGWQFNATTLFAPSTGGVQMTYNRIAPLLQQGWVRHWDSLTRTPFLVNATATQVISYDDSASVTEKVSYLKQRNLGGAIIWAIGQDYLNGQQPLLSAIGAAMAKTTSVAKRIDAEVPGEFALLQNYPNPFNGQTVIQYLIRTAGEYSIRVYNLLGQEVDTLVDGYHLPGRYAAHFDSGTLASGVYLYRLIGTKMTLTKAFVVLR